MADQIYFMVTKAIQFSLNGVICWNTGSTLLIRYSLSNCFLWIIFCNCIWNVCLYHKYSSEMFYLDILHARVTWEFHDIKQEYRICNCDKTMKHLRITVEHTAYLKITTCRVLVNCQTPFNHINVYCHINSHIVNHSKNLLL